MTLGVIFALLAAIFWGSYVVPQVKLKSTPYLIVSILATTDFIVSLIVYGITSPGINNEIIILGFLAGAFWSIAQIYNLIGLKKIKFGRFSSVCSSFQILLNFFLSIIIFNEIIAAGLNNLIIASVGILLVVIGIYNVSSLKSEHGIEFKKAGLFLALFSASLWSLQFIAIRTANANPFSIVVPMTFGMMITAWIYTFLKDKRVSIPPLTLKLSSVAGITWLAGNYLDFFAINEIGLARGFSISQISALVAVLWSILYFKEFMERKNVLTLILSAVAIILGATLLAFAKS